MFLVYICISPQWKSLPLKRKHDDGTGLVKMQEDPRPSTCCCTAKYFLWGANLHSLKIESVFWKDFEIVFDSKWPESIPPPPILWNCQKLKQKIDTDQRHMWSLIWCMENPPRLKSSWVVLVIVSIYGFCGYQNKCWLAMQTIHFHFTGRPSNRCLDLELILWSEVFRC